MCDFCGAEGHVAEGCTKLKKLRKLSAESNSAFNDVALARRQGSAIERCAQSRFVISPDPHA